MGNLQNVNYTFICTVHVPVYQIMDACGLNVRIINQYSDMNGFHGSCQLKLCLARDHLHEIIICYFKSNPCTNNSSIKLTISK